jgi:hypothetical protein
MYKVKKIICIIGSTLLVISCGGGGSDNSSGTASIQIVKYSKVGSFPTTDCIKDNITGLIWEGKTNIGLRNGANKYTNFDNLNSLQISNTSNNGALKSMQKPTETQINDGTNSIGYRNAINTMGLCGYTDWRMPTFEELRGLVDFDAGAGSVAIDITWFPNTFSMHHWTSSGLEKDYPNQEVSDLSKFVVFQQSTNSVNSANRKSMFFVRLVR